MSSHDVTQPVRLIIEGREPCPVYTHTTLTEATRTMRHDGTLYEVTGYIPEAGSSSRGEWAFTLFLQRPRGDHDEAAINEAQKALEGDGRTHRQAIAHTLRGAVWAAQAVVALGLEIIGLRRGDRGQDRINQ